MSGSNFLIGVEDDVNNFHRYLTSSIGGAYETGEIFYVEHLTAEQFRRILMQFKEVDILTVYFSGHGYRANNQDYVCLNKNYEPFQVKSLLTRARRQLTFIDACRTPIDTRGYGDVISGIGFDFPTDNLLAAKRLFCNYIAESSMGGAIVFSTSENQPSIDSENGGVYTKSLMTVLQNWSNVPKEKMITVQDAFKRSVVMTKKHEPQQCPKIYYHGHKTALSFRLELILRCTQRLSEHSIEMTTLAC